MNTATQYSLRLVVLTVTLAILATLANVAYIVARSNLDADLIVLPPCATETDSNCYWDATVRGNGEGVSFIDLDGYVFYIGGQP